MNTSTTGAIGEEICAKHLASKGFLIRAKNYRFGKFEIDIIGEHQGLIVFIEVKYRADDALMAPWQAVNRKKQRQLIRVANHYLQHFNIDSEARFDVVSIVQTVNGPKIEHIEDAFYPIA